MAVTDSETAEKFIAREAKDAAASAAELNALIDDIISSARKFLSTFKDSNQAKDVKMSLDAAVSAARLLGDRIAAFPKAPTTQVLNQTLSLSGLSPDDLRTLINGLKSVDVENEGLSS